MQRLVRLKAELEMLGKNPPPGKPINQSVVGMLGQNPWLIFNF
jgi:hypothetical protein